jgi:hypothetical protein
MFCPVCNGIQTLNGSCPSCAGTVVDCGRVSDYTGPYAPYEPIEEGNLQSSVHLQTRNDCIHIIYCSTCKQTAEVSVAEWR